MAVQGVAGTSEQGVAIVVAVKRVGEGGAAAQRFDPGHRLGIAEPVVRDDPGAKVGDGALGRRRLGEADPVAVEGDGVVGGRVAAAVEAVDARSAAQQIVAVAADQLVVARAGFDPVVAAEAGEDVGMIVAVERLVGPGAGEIGRRVAINSNSGRPS